MINPFLFRFIFNVMFQRIDFTAPQAVLVFTGCGQVVFTETLVLQVTDSVAVS